MISDIYVDWKTQLHILWFGQAMLMAMLAMSLPYWPLYIAQLGDFTPKEIRFWSAAIYIAPFVSSIFSGPLWGKLGDNYGYKPMVIRACMGLFISQTLILFFSNVYWIVVFRLLQGILAGFIVAAQAWALAISPAEERGATMGKLQSATAVGNLLGPLLGGVIATYWGYHSIFSSSSIICLAITILFFCLLQNAKKANCEKRVSESTAKWFSFSWLQKQMITILFVIMIIQVARAMITPIFSLFVIEQLGGNDIMVGVLYAATGLMIFITAPSWGRFFDRLIAMDYPVHLLIVLLLFICAGLQVFHAYAETPITIFMLRIMWGICLGALLPVLLRLLVDHSKNNENGFFLGIGNSATRIGSVLGMILGACIEAYFGYASSFLMTALLYVMSGVVFLFQANLVKMIESK